MVHLPMFFGPWFWTPKLRFLYHVASGVVLVGEVHRHWADPLSSFLVLLTILMNSTV